jgi:hypothetical protein
MNYIRSIYSSIIIVVALALSSCERELEADIVSVTPPSLEVVVRNDANAGIANADVMLYTDEAEWNAEGAPLLTKQTNGEGRVMFTQEELKEPGFFYLIATNGALKAKAKTKYILLTDGKTIFEVILK